MNVADRHGNRTLHIAGRRGYIQIVQMLVDCGADVNALNEDGQTQYIQQLVERKTVLNCVLFY